MTTETNYTHAVCEAVPDLQYQAKFVPHSKSRNADGDPSLNWRVTFSRGPVSLETDYMQGIGHLPGYRMGSGFNPRSIAGDAKVREACEKGRALGSDPYGSLGAKLSPPTIADVLSCLLMDAEAIDYPTFEEWAANYGYDTDSREAEGIYRACLETGLKLRSMLGDANIDKLREALQDL